MHVWYEICEAANPVAERVILELWIWVQFWFEFQSQVDVRGMLKHVWMSGTNSFAGSVITYDYYNEVNSNS